MAVKQRPQAKSPSDEDKRYDMRLWASDALHTEALTSPYYHVQELAWAVLAERAVAAGDVGAILSMLGGRYDKAVLRSVVAAPLAAGPLVAELLRHPLSPEQRLTLYDEWRHPATIRHNAAVHPGVQRVLRDLHDTLLAAQPVGGDPASDRSRMTDEGRPLHSLRSIFVAASHDPDVSA